ncbi:MAG TPA: hypothetical protein VF779_01510 [Pyrinomonadaceae bacterium]
MKNRLMLLFLLCALSFEGHINKVVGAGLAPSSSAAQARGQGQVLPLQNNLQQGFLLVTLNPDGVNRVAQRRKRRPRKAAKKARPKVYGIQAGPAETGGAMPAGQAAPEEMPTMAAPPPPPPGENSSPAPAKKSAPRIKPPTVMIKPPTE